MAFNKFALSSWHTSKYEKCDAVLCLVSQLCPTLCDPMDCSLPGSSVHGDSPGKNTRVGCHASLMVIFPTQGSNPGLLYCRRFLYHLIHQFSSVQLFSRVRLCDPMNCSMSGFPVYNQLLESTQTHVH